MNTPQSSSAVTRRNFLSALGVAAAAGAALPVAAQEKKKKQTGAASPAAAAAPRAGGPPIIHVFSKPLHFLSYEETAKLIVDTGFGGVDYTVRPQGHVLPEKVADDLPRAIEAARKTGAKVDMITTAITGAREPHAEALLRTAAKNGVKIYRCGNFNYDEKLGVWGSLQKLKPQVKELAELNKSLGIHGAIQNHAGTRVGGPVWDLHELLRDIDPQWLGVQYDIRHATVEGAQSWPLGLKLLAPWIRCIDIKDFKWQQAPGKGTIDNCPLGEGIVNFDQFFKLVADLKISGPISVHFEYPPFERVPMSDAEKREKLPGLMRKDLAVLKSHLAKHRLA